jgi:hypothetical protein
MGAISRYVTLRNTIKYYRDAMADDKESSVLAPIIVKANEEMDSLEAQIQEWIVQGSGHVREIFQSIDYAPVTTSTTRATRKSE